MRPRMRPGKGSCHAEDAEALPGGEPRALYFLPACSVRSAIQRAFLGAGTAWAKS
jgi:hypothetical protein